MFLVILSFTHSSLFELHYDLGIFGIKKRGESSYALKNSNFIVDEEKFLLNSYEMSPVNRYPWIFLNTKFLKVFKA